MLVSYHAPFLPILCPNLVPLIGTQPTSMLSSTSLARLPRCLIMAIDGVVDVARVMVKDLCVEVANSFGKQAGDA